MMSLPYTAPDTAFELASRRLRDRRLQEKVSVYLGGIWPMGFEELPDTPAAVYAPYMATGNGTEVDFLRQAKDPGFDRVVATYRSAPWSKGNPAMRDCYQPPLRLPGDRQVRDWVVPAKGRSGPVGRALTKYPDLPITQYWVGIRRAVLANEGQQDNRVVDFGDWYDLQACRLGRPPEAARSPYYYRALMGLYASGRGVLYDTPPTEYAERVMRPAFEEAASALGAEPLVTNVLAPPTPDWVDLTFLSEPQAKKLQEEGRLG
jgi:hypothetical protein